jgi:hypothetical protein
VAVREGNGSFERHSGKAVSRAVSRVVVTIREEIGSFVIVRHSAEAAELIGP